MTNKSNPVLTEKDVKTLLKLLSKFSKAEERDGGGNWVPPDTRIQAVISLVRKWVEWYGRDELGMDL